MAGAVPLARRPRERHVQAEAKDRGKLGARERHADDSPPACPTARAATPNLRREGAKTTKYPTRGVLHDVAQSGDHFRRE